MTDQVAIYLTFSRLLRPRHFPHFPISKPLSQSLDQEMIEGYEYTELDGDNGAVSSRAGWSVILSGMPRLRPKSVWSEPERTLRSASDAECFVGGEDI